MIGAWTICASSQKRASEPLAKTNRQQAWGIMAMVADPDGNVLALWEDRVPDGEAHASHVDQADGAY